MADISFHITCKELKIAQIAQLNQFFQLLHLVHIYGQGFYELRRMLMRKNVNNDVSKDSPIENINNRFIFLNATRVAFSEDIRGFFCLVVNSFSSV